MSAHTELLKGLRGTLLAVLSESPGHRQLNRMVDICHALAFAAVCMKSARGRLYQEGGRDLSDLAYDCIGDLFQRDESGRLVRIKAYFESVDLQLAAEEELLVHLRRLVFSSVNQSLFRIYNDVDPAIGKILRNIKLAVRSIGNFVEDERLGEPCIAPALCNPLDHLPPIELDQLQGELARVVTGTELIPTILAKLSLLLRKQSEYSRLIPVITVARAIRGVYGIKQLGPSTEGTVADTTLENDLAAACHWASSVVRKRAEQSYVARRKVKVEVLDKYFEAIDEYLAGKLNGGATDSSLFESLVHVFPRIGRREYNHSHRARLEYLSRQVEKLVLERLRKP